MNNSRTTSVASRWHAGELQMQRMAGVDEALAGLDVRIFRNSLTTVQQEFYARLTYAVIGGVDRTGAAWVSVIEGAPGFLAAHGAFALDVHGPLSATDPVTQCLGNGEAVGMLGIDLSTRRRLRLNGQIARESDEWFRVDVQQSFGNCPQYIQARDVSATLMTSAPPAPDAEHLTALDESARQLISEADTFFVASYVDRETGERQIDASHRGGLPGFVRVGRDGILMIPDFPGNKFYNTLGNFALNPKAGLCFVDFASGDVLHLTGDVTLTWPTDAHFDEAEQFWQFIPRALVRRRAALRQRWSLVDGGWSPDSVAMGHWRL